MNRIKSILVSLMTALIILASFGFGIMMIGFAIVLGGAFALTIRLAAMGHQPQANTHGEDEVVDGDVQPA